MSLLRQEQLKEEWVDLAQSFRCVHHGKKHMVDFRSGTDCLGGQVTENTAQEAGWGFSLQNHSSPSDPLPSDVPEPRIPVCELTGDIPQSHCNSSESAVQFPGGPLAGGGSRGLRGTFQSHCNSSEPAVQFLGGPLEDQGDLPDVDANTKASLPRWNYVLFGFNWTSKDGRTGHDTNDGAQSMPLVPSLSFLCGFP